MHGYLLYNGEVRRTADTLLSPGQVGFLNGWGVFSTLRVCDGVLFAYERHYSRMRNDAARLRVPLRFTSAELEQFLLRLVDANRAFNATLRVAIIRNRGGAYEGPNISREADLIAFTTDLTQWGQSAKLSYVPHARFGASPFAGAKITSWAENLTWYEEAHERGFDEVILLNEHGQVSECTSANVFAVQADRVYTPPLSTSGCLPGVTRALLLEEMRVPGLIIAERELTPADLESSDQVFITSSTRDILPVSEIDHKALRHAPSVVDNLKQAFLQLRSNYVATHPRRNEIFA